MKRPIFVCDMHGLCQWDFSFILIYEVLPGCLFAVVVI